VPEWTDRATFAFLFLSHLMIWKRDLFSNWASALSGDE
jgi:hypothetical protein